LFDSQLIVNSPVTRYKQIIVLQRSEQVIV